MLYEKKVRYLEHYEGGVRVGSSGFAKIEARDSSLRMDLTVKGLHPTDSFTREVLLCGGGKEAPLGTIVIEGGTGVFRHMCHIREQIDKTGISYEEWSGIRIFLGGSREISSRWEPLKKEQGILENKEASQEVFSRRSPGKLPAEAGGMPSAEKADPDRKAALEGTGNRMPENDREEKAESAVSRLNPETVETEEKAEASVRRTSPEAAETEEKAESAVSRLNPEAVETEEKAESAVSSILSRETDTERKAVSMRNRDLEAERPLAGGISLQEKTEPKARMASEGEMVSTAGKKRSPGRFVNLQEDKWKQLSSIYPHIQPFHDKRDYLSLGPADFVLFPAQSYKAVNNSFLLHGYYNYHHLLLTRVEKRGETVYYVGVPGNYYEKEKQVAVMFGFESFECAEEPAQTGDFGYYMMRVEI